MRSEILQTERGGCLDAAVTKATGGRFGVETQQIKTLVPYEFSVFHTPKTMEGSNEVIYRLKRKIVRNSP